MFCKILSSLTLLSSFVIVGKFSLPYLFSQGKCNENTLMRFYIDTHLCTIYIGLVYYDNYPTFYSTVTKNSVELCFAPPLAYTREWHSIPYVLLSSSSFGNWTIISDGGPITPICVSVIPNSLRDNDLGLWPVHVLLRAKNVSIRGWLVALTWRITWHFILSCLMCTRGFAYDTKLEPKLHNSQI